MPASIHAKITEVNKIEYTYLKQFMHSEYPKLLLSHTLSSS